MMGLRFRRCVNGYLRLSGRGRQGCVDMKMISRCCVMPVRAYGVGITNRCYKLDIA